MPKISNYLSGGGLAPGDDLIVERNNSNYKIGLEYGSKLVWDAVDGYHIELGARGVNGSLLEWSASIARAGLALANSTLYYVYLYDNGGTPAVEESTTAPAWNSTYLYWQKTGDADYRFVGYLVTDSSGNIYRFVCEMHGDTVEYYFLDDAMTLSPFNIISGGSTTGSWAAVDLTGLIPATLSTAWFANIRLSFTGDSDEAACSVSPIDLGAADGTRGMLVLRNDIGGAGGKTFVLPQWCPIITSLTAYYRMLIFAGTVTVDIDCRGCRYKS
jgi:hypothetical protein